MNIVVARKKVKKGTYLHSGVKAYQCPQCRYSYSQNESLKKDTYLQIQELNHVSSQNVIIHVMRKEI